MEFFFKAMGTKQVSVRFNRMGASAIKMRPTMETLADLIFGIEEATFDAQGRRGGGAWRSDSPDWLARKLRNGLDPRINHATLALRNAMTTHGAPGQILRITDSSLELTTDLPQAAPSQRNRPFVAFTVRDKDKMREMIKAHFEAAWNA